MSIGYSDENPPTACLDMRAEGTGAGVEFDIYDDEMGDDEVE